MLRAFCILLEIMELISYKVQIDYIHNLQMCCNASDNVLNWAVAFIATGNHVIADTATVINTSRNSLSAICPVSGNRDGPHMIIYLAYNNNIRAIENARRQPD